MPHRLTVLPPTEIEQLAAAVRGLTDQITGLRADIERYVDRKDEA